MPTQKLDTPKIITDMDFELAEEHQMVREMTRGFVEKEVKPVAPAWTARGVILLSWSKD